MRALAHTHTTHERRPSTGAPGGPPRVLTVRIGRGGRVGGVRRRGPRVPEQREAAVVVRDAAPLSAASVHRRGGGRGRRGGRRRRGLALAAAGHGADAPGANEADARRRKRCTRSTPRRRCLRSRRAQRAANLEVSNRHCCQFALCAIGVFVRFAGFCCFWICKMINIHVSIAERFTAAGLGYIKKLE